MQGWGGKPGIKMTLGVSPPMASRRQAAAAPAPSGSDPAILRRIGETVLARLSATPGMSKTDVAGLDMFTMPDFLSPAECAALIAIIDDDVSPSLMVTSAADRTQRTSETCELPIRDPIVASVERRLSALFATSLRQGESPQGQRYRPGQLFGTHSDYFEPSAAYFAGVMQQGGQRTWTAMIYLNAPEEGGETRFPNAGLSVAPVPGMLLTWNNIDRDGRPNPQAHHEGARVDQGSKYVLTKWWRERAWTAWGSLDPDAISKGLA